jgi:hypothetical protein
MKTFFVIRNGWNSVNQPSAFAKRNPKNQFESKQFELVAIVEATSDEEACSQFTGSVYSNQSLFATSNARSAKGLTKAIESFEHNCEV